MFFSKKDKVHRALRRLIQRLENAGIDYCIVGGLALNAHGYERVTKDIDVLMSRSSFQRFREELGHSQYQLVPGRRRRFAEKRSAVTIDVLVSGLFPGDGKPKPLAFPNPRSVSVRKQGQRIVELKTLIELKLAARRWKDFADVVELIRANRLDESLTKKLHSYVRRDYVECLEEYRREEEYEKRQDRAP
jgi:hypothetical protein